MAKRKGGSVAIIGMQCIFPGAPDIKAYWSNIRTGKKSFSEVPEHRWPAVYYDPESDKVDRFYCQQGGFVDDYALFDPLAYGIMPIAAAGSEPDQMLALDVAARAIHDSGYAPSDFSTGRTAVVLGRGNYIGAGMTRLEQHVRTAEQLATSLKDLIPGLEPSVLADVKNEFQEKLGAYGSDTAIGLVPNLTASRIANRLDFKGPAYTVDGACASSLLAIDQCVQMLRSGRCDAAIAGGVHLSHDVAFWSVFCQLGALSRRQEIRPFDQDADGLLIGEGLGMVVLKLRDDAIRDGDRIYAVIDGVGVSSDGREASIMTPRIEGQLAALEMAWADADRAPDTVGYIEAHGTATPAGDSAELSTLSRFFGQAGEKVAGLGSVKALIGHTMPAAGIAGLIKAALSVYHGVIPPAVGCRTPHRLLNETRFRLPDREEAWETDARIAGVNAFGFGGINAHVVLSNASQMDEQTPGGGQVSVLPLVTVWSGQTNDELLRALEADRRDLIGATAGPHRIIIHDVNSKSLARAKGFVKKKTRCMGRLGIWYEPTVDPSRMQQVAFLFPGVEAQFRPMAADLLEHSGQDIRLDPNEDDVEAKGYAVVQLGRLLNGLLIAEGVIPSAYAGHSVGEWTAMITSGLIDETSADAFIRTLSPGSLEVPGVLFLAAGCSIDTAEDAITGMSHISVSHDNCPHQVILCGAEDEIRKAKGALEAQRVLCQVLPFRSGFHSVLFDNYVGPHREHFSSLNFGKPHTPVWSATLSRPFPSLEADVRDVAIRHLTERVRFRGTIESLYEAGNRIFIQCGSGSVGGFIGDTLRGQPHTVLNATDDKRSGFHQFLRLKAALYALGLKVDPFHPLRALNTGPERPKLRLQLGVPLVRLETPLPQGEFASDPFLLPDGDPIFAAYKDVLRTVVDASKAVTEAYVKGHSNEASEYTETRHLSVESNPALLDHCFFRQPPDWHCVEDRFPVVPLTMLIEIMKAAASRVSPRRRLRAVEHLRAYKWLVVEPAVDITVVAKRVDADHIRVQIEGYCECLVIFGDAYAQPPKPSPLRPDRTDLPLIGGRQLYDERWMFHGPAYQGIQTLTGLTKNGICGRLRNLQALGGLLDNAGQLLGYWVMVNTEVDRLAMPFMVEEMEWFGPEPEADATLDCTVHIKRLTKRQVRADIELVLDGRVWCHIKGWADQRFDTNAQTWPIIRYPERHLMATVDRGYAMVHKPFSTPASQDYFHRRYLDSHERTRYQEFDGDRQYDWLAGRIAAKDAVRKLLKTTLGRDVFPVEISIRTNEHGAPAAIGQDCDGVHVSLSHKHGVAVALASTLGPVGIDIEEIAPRDAAFVAAAFSQMELDALPNQDDHWLTRLWCAKEAAAKAGGLGLQGRPKALQAIWTKDHNFVVGRYTIYTETLDQFIVAWTKGGIGRDAD